MNIKQIIIILALCSAAYAQIPGDITGDNKVNMQDYAIISQNWLRQATPQDANITITANGVTDVGGEVMLVEFYLDIDGNDELDPNNDLLLGIDTDDEDGWFLVIPADTQPIGINLYHARAVDDSGNWSEPVSTCWEIIPAWE